MTRVLFWDIDGTLLTVARTGVLALEQAFRDVLGREPDLGSMSTAGGTDGGIVKLVFDDMRVGYTPELGEEVLRAYESHLPDRLGRREGRTMPGVREVLEDLQGREDVLCLLLTGNTELGAAAKLAHYGLEGFFRGGAFSVDDAPREEIARRGRALAAEVLGAEPDDEHVYVIGDTVHDIRCGKAIGARTIAVMTGPVDRAELEQAEPWALLDRIPPPEEFRALIGLHEDV